MTGPGGALIPSAGVALTNTSTGNTREGTADSRGRFVFDALPVGGPYRVTARFIGYQPASIAGITLHVGDRLHVPLVLGELGAPMLAEVAVRGSTLRDAGAGGPAYAISGEDVSTLPLLNRNFAGLLAIAPQATGSSALSVNGQHSRFNAIQVDGGSAGDFFGVNATPGAAPGGRFISLEALDEIRVLVAPFDVRQGGFSGGLINAVTRSGTNERRGAIWVSNTRAQLVGRDTAGQGVPAFDLVQYGASIGGPIIRDRLHYFAVADIQARRAQFVGPTTSDPSTGITTPTAQRAAMVLRDRYGIAAGGIDAPRLAQPNVNLFAKLSAQLGTHNWLELTYAGLDARSDVLSRTPHNRPDRDGWQLSSSGYVTRAKTMTTRLKATSAIGAFTNEVVASVGTIDDYLESTNRTPLFLVAADAPAQYLAGGSVKNAQGTATGQRIIELTDNLSWSRGAHVVTAGTQNQLLRFRDNFFLGSWGVWTFGSVDSLAQALPFRYEVALPLRPGGPRANFSSLQLAGYLQDRWSITPRLTVTGGVRADVPFVDAPSRNTGLLASAPLGNVDTGVFPSGNAVLSPRVGFALTLGAAGATLLRGGAGSFAGRPPYAWLGTAFANTGQDQTLLICTASDGVPAPTSDIGRLPRGCLNGNPASQRPSVSYFDRDFRFQQAIKYDLGVDHDFGAGLTLSLDVIHSRSRDELTVNDVNLVPGAVNGEGRVTYGVIAGTGRTPTVSPARVDSAYRGVYRFGNGDGGRSTALTAVVHKRWPNGGQVEVGYNWSRTEDRSSLAGFTGPIFLQNNPLDGSLARRTLRRSARDIPQNVVMTGIAPLGFGLTGALFARARSGTPYAYTVDGDANADGVVNNDLLFVPRDLSQVSLTNPTAFAALDAFIAGDRCLRQQRGRIIARGSCRNPAVLSVDASLTKAFGGRGGRGIEITADVFNVPNLLNRDWGLIRETSSREDKQGVLSVAGWDAAANRPRYTVLTAPNGRVLASRRAIVADASRWRMQLGARYNL